MFERYNIVSESDFADAVRRLDERHGHSLGIVRAVGTTDAEPIDENAEEKLEAPPGFEPGMEVLQTSALPLGDGAGWIVLVQMRSGPLRSRNNRSGPADAERDEPRGSRTSWAL